MSDSATTNTFQAAAWHRKPVSGSDLRKASIPDRKGVDREGFAPLYEPKKVVTSSAAFVSPYVSEEKLRLLNASEEQPEEEIPPSPPPPDPEEIAREAYEKGFSQGEAAGIASGLEKAKEIVDQIQHALTEIEETWRNLLANYETQLIRLVCSVAEKVVYGQIEIDQDVVKRAILNAFSVIPEPVGVTIEVNPKDYEFIETIKEDFFSHVSSLKDVSVLTSASIVRGGCRILTRAGQVDATLESRLEAVKNSLIEANEIKKRR